MKNVRGCGNDGTASLAVFSFNSIFQVPGTAPAITMGGEIQRTCQYVAYGGDFFYTGFDGDETLTSPATRSFPTGVPLVLNLEIRATGDSSGYLGAGADTVAGRGVTGFGSTVSFPTDGPVFNLPEGYTANSVDGRIVDNRWSPVPIGPSGALLGTGLAFLLPRLRRRRLDS